MSAVRIFIADDHPIVRKGIKAIFSDEEDYVVVGEAENGLKAFQGVSAKLPDLVILDISMPELDGILVTERIKKDFPDIKVIVLSMHQSCQYAIDAFRAGASGYILKGGEVDEIRGVHHRRLDAGRRARRLPGFEVIVGQWLGLPLLVRLAEDLHNVAAGSSAALERLVHSAGDRHVGTDTQALLLAGHGRQATHSVDEMVASARCRGGGIGRRWGLKIPWAYARASSILALGTSLRSLLVSRGAGAAAASSGA